MKVVVSVYGRFHGFNLAGQMERLGCLQRLITSYPKYQAARYGIPKHKVSSLLYLEIANRVWGKTSGFVKDFFNAQFALHNAYDHSAKHFIPPVGDIFVGFSSYSLHSLQRAKKMGYLTVLERGSSHIEYQTEVLKEEYKKYGLEFNATHPKVIEREIAEYEKCDFISIPSSFVQETFLERGVRENKLIQIPYGVDLSSFHPMEKKDRKFRVLHVGGITLQKGVHHLVQAFHELNFPDSELWLIGEVSTEIKPILAKHWDNKMYLKGPFPQKDLHGYYSEGSVLCLLSIQDGFGMVVPQAMACGLPVICTETTGAKDIVEDGRDGFVIPTGNISAAKEAITRLYENLELRRKMSMAALGKAAAGLSWETYGERMTDAYRKLLHNHGHAGKG